MSVRFHFDVTSISIPFQVGFTSSSLRFHFEAERETSPLKGKGNRPEAIREKGNRLEGIREKGKGRDTLFRRVSTTPTNRAYARTNETKRFPGWTHPPNLRYIYTSTGFGLRKNKKMAGVDHFLVYMQTAVKYSCLYVHHPGGGAAPPGLYKLWYFTAVCIYTKTWSTPDIFLFFLGPNPVVVYIFGVSIS